MASRSEPSNFRMGGSSGEGGGSSNPPSQASSGSGKKLMRRNTSFGDRLSKQGAIPKPPVRQLTRFPRDESALTRYDGYDLAQSLLRYEKKRIVSLKYEGRFQVFAPKSNEGWIATLFTMDGRALDWMGLPFILALAHAIVYTLVQEVALPYMLYFKNEDNQDGPKYNSNWEPKPTPSPASEDDSGIREIFFALVLNTTLASLLAYRLDRATDHFYIARDLWSRIIERGRNFVGQIIAHGSHNLVERDHAVRWLCAFVISIMELLRGSGELPSQHFSGLLSVEEIRQLSDNAHPPVYAANKVRYHLKRVFHIDNDTPWGLSHAWLRHMDSMEFKLNHMLDSCGGLQRIRATPLPLVAVSHLRSLLLVTIFLLPYIWGQDWGWRTIPIVALSAFSWLGIEACSAELELPFNVDRVNALNMDGFCIGFLQTTTQLIVNHAEEDIERKRRQAEYKDRKG